MQHLIESAAVFALAMNLGSQNFHVREATTSALYSMGGRTLPYLAHIEKHGCLESKVRARGLTFKWRSDNAPKIAGLFGVLPWIYPVSCTIVVDEETRQLYLSRARRTVGMHGPPDWLDYRLATRMLVEDLIYRGVEEKEITSLLSKLAKEENEWIRQNGKRFDPPIINAP